MQTYCASRSSASSAGDRSLSGAPLTVPFTGLWMVDKIRPDLADVRVFIDTHPDRSVNRDNVTLWLGLHQLGCVISPRVGQPSIEPRHENLIERFPSQTRCSKSRSRPAV